MEKEIAIKLHIYKEIDTDTEDGPMNIDELDEKFPGLYKEITSLLEKHGYQYQVYEAELNSI